MYNRRLHDGDRASTVFWPRTRSIHDHAIFDSYLPQSTMRFRTRNSVWTRVEKRAVDLQAPESAPQPAIQV